MLPVKNTTISVLCLVCIIFSGPRQSDAQNKFICNLNANLNDKEIESNRQSINKSDLVFTVKRIESFLTITGWASDGYKCTIGKILKGNIKDDRIDLYLFYNSLRSKNLRQLQSNDTLLLGFVKQEKRKSTMEGFREKNGTGWDLGFIKYIKFKGPAPMHKTI